MTPLPEIGPTLRYLNIPNCPSDIITVRSTDSTSAKMIAKVVLLCLATLAAAQYGPKYDAPVYAKPYGAPAPYEEKPQPYSFGYDAKDEYGATLNRKEESDDYGNKRGSYGYTDGYGIYRQVDYVADEKGFRAVVKTNEPGTENQNSADAEIHSEAAPVKYEPAPAYAKPYAPAAPAYSKPAPVYKPAPAAYAPAPAYKPAPAVYAPAPAYQPAPAAYAPAPAYKPAPAYAPAPVYAPEPAYKPAPSVYAPAPVYKPAPAAYAPVYDSAAPKVYSEPAYPGVPVYESAPAPYEPVAPAHPPFPSQPSGDSHAPY
ncbi:Cuticle protein 16.8 like protein [Argiope bruennichi]|uniref:Cuticle protein 16.8 like protein n=1 Tax=Argiope bruennichi TaxID=94029 RepID=A0A8T0EZH2_ARGBR|nr:Cuticle protein 16.8 like protein [Argiope bruennichi]